MYDKGDANRSGLGKSQALEQRKKTIADAAERRQAEFMGGKAKYTSGTAHSREFSEDAYNLAAEPKELYLVPGAGQVDLHDRVSLIRWDKLTSLFTKHLSEGQPG